MDNMEKKTVLEVDRNKKNDIKIAFHYMQSGHRHATTWNVLSTWNILSCIINLSLSFTVILVSLLTKEWKWGKKKYSNHYEHARDFKTEKTSHHAKKSTY